ncbi:MAG: metallophosphoesterase [Candidatus Micrarchaeota archaeon]|mgnify:CR=1 FL=1
MHVFVFSDLHDEEVVFEELRKKYEESKCIFTLILGDTTNDSPKFLEEVVSSFENCFFIPGNNEPENAVKRVSSSTSHKGYLHGKRVELADRLNVVGFGKSNPTPFGTPGELSEDEIHTQMQKLPIDNNTILILHVPPLGFFDEVTSPRGNLHIGSSSVRKIIEEKKPLVVFCGHVHELEGMAMLGSTYIIKVPAAKLGRYCIAEIDEKTRNVGAEFFSL